MQQKPVRLHFCGYEWNVKHAPLMGPGPNRWESANVRLDNKKRLHLTVRRDAQGWSCAEIQSVQPLHFGTYEFQTSGPLGALDPNLVLGLFNYPLGKPDLDGTNEIDIEYARWGDPKNLLGNFTLHPAIRGTPTPSLTFPVPADLTDATHRFTWQPDRLTWQTLRGHARSLTDSRHELARFTFAAPTSPLPQSPLPVLINLWLFQAHPPITPTDTTLTLTHFTHRPA